jgi:hypothetical protein
MQELGIYLSRLGPVFGIVFITMAIGVGILLFLIGTVGIARTYRHA